MFRLLSIGSSDVASSFTEYPVNMGAVCMQILVDDIQNEFCLIYWKCLARKLLQFLPVCNHHSTFCIKSFSFHDSISLQINGLWYIYKTYVSNQTVWINHERGIDISMHCIIPTKELLHALFWHDLEFFILALSKKLNIFGIYSLRNCWYLEEEFEDMSNINTKS